MSEMWYKIVMSSTGMLIFCGIFLAWMILRKIEKHRGNARSPYPTVMLLGGLLTSLGFAWGVLGSGGMTTAVLSLILIGPAMIGYALANVGVEGITGRLMIQSVLTLLSLFLAGNYSTVAVDVAYAGPFLALLLLMNAHMMIERGIQRHLLVLSSWLIVLFSWTRYALNDTYGILKATIVLPYVAAVLLWVGVLTVTYFKLSSNYPTLHITAQEGL
ncbi:hypothetical protein [Thermococcus aciditolerans]|uniref:Uncharacterized protein n=1 Tax=Thermococcus aciditolerans TaxID=2598455 RepID=A0A5C0SL86_9EURY|nr:hypothetical protein [Thermococcus aciditolerans]QEK14194.1 hypothetical protein FPV09_02690 [Thermococcus aciditolerans]